MWQNTPPAKDVKFSTFSSKPGIAKVQKIPFLIDGVL
jgi:hypothetical protein